MKLFSIAFLIGICGIWFLKQMPSFYLIGFILFLSCSLFYRYKNKFTLLLFGLSLGFVLVCLVTQYRIHQIIPKNIEGKSIKVIGTIYSLPKQQNRRISFLFKIDSRSRLLRNRLLKLSWFYGPDHLVVGDQWFLTIRIKRPHGFANPGGFDYETWLFQKGINGTGYVQNVVTNRMIHSSLLHHPIGRIRQYLENKLLKGSLKDEPLIEILSVFIVGSRNHITSKEWEIFRRTGTNHLIAIAGLHIGVIVALIFFIVSWLLCRVPLFTMLIPSKIAAYSISLFIASIYALVSGFSMQTQRALIMLSVFVFAMIFRRQVFSSTSLSLSMLIILILNPLSILSSGFWLSFITVSIIIYSMSWRLNIKGLWLKFGKVQWVIMLGIFPLTLWFFHEFSWVSVVANIIAVPWFCFVIIPLSFLGLLCLLIVPGTSNVFLIVALKNIQYFWVILNYLAKLKLIDCVLTINSIGLLMMIYVGVLLLLSPRGMPARYLFLFMFLSLIRSSYRTPMVGEIWFTLLDVGQGLASIVQTKNHVLVYDTGPGFDESFNAGTMVLLPYLTVNHISHIDKLVISHGDNDHIGGANSLLKNIKVSTVLTSVPDHFRNQTIPVSVCHRGQKWTWDGVLFEVISPNRHYDGSNNNSCVLKVSTGHKSILLTGDIEEKVETELVRDHTAILKSTILIAPHHGSRTSSSLAFVKSVSPHYVLFPIGYLNRFHFPNHVIYQRYQSIHAACYDTAHDGAIRFVIKPNDKEIKRSTYRQNYHYVWKLNDS